ncbi:MAG: hypothetical protein ACR2PF_10990 [Rhizobiaceae bacterium]
MKAGQKSVDKQEKLAKLQIWMAGKSSRNKSLSDKVCRFLVSRASAVKPEDDFLRDPLIDEDQGFDPDELDRFQYGKEAKSNR